MHFFDDVALKWTISFVFRQSRQSQKRVFAFTQTQANLNSNSDCLLVGQCYNVNTTVAKNAKNAPDPLFFLGIRSDIAQKCYRLLVKFIPRIGNLAYYHPYLQQ